MIVRAGKVSGKISHGGTEFAEDTELLFDIFILPSSFLLLDDIRIKVFKIL